VASTVPVVTMIEWPHGSGISADYSEAEREVVRALFRACSSGEISEEQRDREVGVVHDLKALLDARIAPAEEAPDVRGPEQAVFYLPEPGSVFQIPARALERLGIPA
jgi:hypothetical protein